MLIHASHRSEARHAARGVGLVLLVLIVLYAVPGLLTGNVTGGFAALAALLTLDTLAIVMAALVFAVVWSARREGVSGNMVLVASAFLGVALMDFSHQLLGQALPVGAHGSGPNGVIYFWLSARLLGSLSLLAAAWLPWRRRDWRGAFRLAVVLVLVLTLALTLYASGWPALPMLPQFVAGGADLLPFKNSVEYGLIVINLAAAARFAWCMRRPRRFNASGLFAACVVMAAGALVSTSFTHPYQSGVLVAEAFKVVAIMFLYRAVFVETVRHPYALLRESEQQLAATLEALPDLLMELDGQGNYLQVHSSSPRGLARQRDHLLGRNVRDVLAPRAARTALDALIQARRDGVCRGRVINVDTVGGETRQFELSVAFRPAMPGRGERFVCIARDVTQRRQAEQELRRLSSAVAQSPVAIMVTDREARLEYVNQAFTRITGYGADEVLGRNVHQLLASDKTPAATVAEMWQALDLGQGWSGEMINRTRDGEERVMSALIYPLRDHAGNITHFLSHQQDITASKRAARLIQELSHFDRLTGLPNRAMLQEYFQHARGRDEALALLWIDVDRFKDINDALGHDAGDLLLLEVSHRVHTCLRSQDLLSRHSGDEFVVLVPVATQEAVADLAAGLLSALAQPLELEKQRVFVTASIGVAFCPDDAQDLDGLLKKAEIAVYRAKDAGRNRCCYFTAEMQARTTRRVAMGNALKLAHQRGELHLVYQPQVTIADGRIVGAEALLRWDSPELGKVSPSDFIPVAEDNGAIVAIGEWVLETALRQLRQWRDAGLPAMTMAVNISAVQFDRADLAQVVEELLLKAGVPADCLELELTEAAAMKTPHTARERMAQLARRNVRLAIDDFGTGYSSLSYLKQFQINKLKIDQSFVRDISTDADDQAIAKAVVQMARSLGIITIAEGVETAAQLAILREHGCHEVQGYYYSKPLPAAAFEAFVRHRM